MLEFEALESGLSISYLFNADELRRFSALLDLGLITDNWQTLELESEE